MNVTKIECFVDDKNVGTVQRVLASLGVRDVKSVPVAGAKLKNGIAMATTDGSGAVGVVKSSLFGDGRKQERRFKKGDKVPLKEIAAIMTGNGLSANSARYVASKLVEAGIFKASRTKRGQRKVYEVLK